MSLRPVPLLLSTLFVLAPGSPEALSQERGAVVGVAAPLSGPRSSLGEQLEAGARLAADASQVSVVEADTQCSAEGGVEAAETLVEAGSTVVLGFLCTDALLAALPPLTEAGIPVIDIGVRTNRVTDDREKTGHLVWRLAPRSDAEAAALADWIASNWEGEPFGLIEDGSIANRGLVDTVRRLLADRGLEPSATDNYRPAEEKQFGLARRLARTGVTRFLIAGDRPDIAVIARDAAELGLDLQIVGGESLLDETAPDQSLAAGVTALAPPYAHRLEAADGSPERTLPGYSVLAYAAMQIAAQAIGAAGETGQPLKEALDAGSFETILGPVSFDAKGDASAVAYQALRWNGEAFVREDEAGRSAAGG
ncbi:ABC transporter substrate-binding protein [Fulvimarina endophytica]|uniref:ABC transporter substrate-binding protein n=2 Tax=Fulvimarina endophytica TaxID=2293836 RepID=A0A371X1T0_9HYPH|nr:ABC transporter substrate-binding protein [Fulvimarina endophytica]